MKQVLSVPAQLGPMLQAARRASGLSQTELAGRMGVSQSRISHMELAPESISVGQLMTLFGLLGLEAVVQQKDGVRSTSRAGAAGEW